jgi:acyl-CoA synthetase (NDP forming)
VLGLPDLAGVRAAAEQIVGSVRAAQPDTTVDRVLVQRMQPRGVADVLVGYRVAPDVGPLVVLSTGGVLAEIFADSAVRLAPVDAGTAREMIDEVRGLSVATGYRGLPAGDIDALVETIVAVSRLAVEEPAVLEAEINPLSVGAEGAGVTALDALVRRAAVSGAQFSAVAAEIAAV